MTRREYLLLAAALAIMAGGALFLSTWADRQRLGTPGVVLKPEPFPGLKPGATNALDLVMVGTNHVDLPSQVPGYGSILMPLDSTVWGGLPADTVFGQRLYTNGVGFPIQSMVVLMGTDRTSIHQPQYCLRGAGWAITQSEQAHIRIEKPHPYDLPVTKLIPRRTMKDPDGHVRELSGVFLYWFVADGQLTSEHRDRMWLLARDLITKGVLQRWAYVICFRPCLPGQEDQTYAELADFVAASVPEYQLTAGPPVQPVAQPRSAASLPASTPAP